MGIALAEMPTELSLSPEALLSQHPGPAFLVDEEANVLAANARAVQLVEQIDATSDASLVALIKTAFLGQNPLHQRIQLSKQRSEVAVILDLSMLPLVLGNRRYALVLCRDATFECNFTAALTASRKLFRDLVNCSSDFAWETRPDGTFGFVSPRGALGYTAHELVGLPARKLVHSRNGDGTPLPFESQEPLESVEVWLRDAAGEPVCLLISCVPILLESGECSGTRGVCRDVTKAREHDAELVRARNREALLGRIVDTIRNEIDPDRVLYVAAEAMALAVNAEKCWIFRTDETDKSEVAAEFTASRSARPASLVTEMMETLARNSDAHQFEQRIDDYQVLTAPSRYHDKVNGAICVARRQSEVAWNDDDRALLDGVAAQLGIAIMQIASHERLGRLSRTDDLTGLLNRRAFFSDAGRRMRHLRRKHRDAALLYVDLDNFKGMNDTHGHQAGDEVLRGVAAVLAHTSRAGDICGRMGGDEFVLWLEETDEAAATAKAAAVLKQCEQIAANSPSVTPPLGASVGVALSDAAHGESLEVLLARADRAMYEAKHKGKRAFSIAPPAPQNLSNSA